jgi:dolichol-phosphate mannosyltransferase
MRLLITVPTYNEAENIEAFIRAVFAVFAVSAKNPDFAELLVIDDNSPDGTAAIVEKLIPEYAPRLHILKRQKKEGLGAAYLAAFDWGLSRGYDAFLEMDADFSHKPEYIIPMVEKISAGYDVVIGSRNVKGGAVEGWTFLRNFISKGGSLYSRLVLGLPIRDLTGGFNLWNKTALEKIGLKTIISTGFAFQIEMKYKAHRSGCAIYELPIIFPDRKLGKSKMSKKILLEAFIKIWRIRRISPLP